MTANLIQTIDPEHRPSRAEAEQAVRTLLRWAGDDPTREGLIGTPGRVARAFEEWFAGYDRDPVDYLQRTFEEVENYDEMVVLRDIRFESHCEHHLAPIIGRAHIGYLPRGRVVGISKLARVVELYAKRLQIQEKMTAQIANSIAEVLQARRSRRRSGGDPSMHDHSGRSQIGRYHGDQPHARCLPGQSVDPPRVPDPDRQSGLAADRVIRGPHSPLKIRRGKESDVWPKS